MQEARRVLRHEIRFCCFSSYIDAVRMLIIVYCTLCVVH